MFNLLLVAVALVGFLPLVIIVYKLKWIKKILAEGMVTKATVHRTYYARKSHTDTVHYSFSVNTGEQFSGSLVTKHGKYRAGHTIEVYYLPLDPKRNTVKEGWGPVASIAFGALIAVIVLFAVYRIWTSQ
jgi:hypothetical protein